VAVAVGWSAGVAIQAARAIRRKKINSKGGVFTGLAVMGEKPKQMQWPPFYRS
jgi:hypothetical protein